MASKNAQSETNIVPRLVEMTPYQVYLRQIQGATDAIRASRAGFDYIAPQFGGLIGQLQTMKEQIVLQLIDFQVGEGK